MTIITNNAADPTSAIRDKNNVIRIRTKNRLSDDQMRDLFVIAFTMSETGKTLNELVGQKCGISKNVNDALTQKGERNGTQY